MNGGFQDTVPAHAGSMNDVKLEDANQETVESAKRTSRTAHSSNLN